MPKNRRQKNGRIDFSRSIIIFLTLVLSTSLLFFLQACKSSTIFGPIVMCESINKDTLEPVSVKNTFQPTDAGVIAAVKYNTAEENDVYSFTWTNTDTQKVLKTKDYYFSAKNNLSEGYLVSVLYKKESSSIISPGKYKVDFFYNGKFQSTAEFEVQDPAIKIISAMLSDSKNTSSGNEPDKTEFVQTDTIILNVYVNYLLKDNTITAKWLDDTGETVLEYPYKIEETQYSPKSIPFIFQSGTGILPAGNYKIAVLLNDETIEEKDFTVIETQLEIAGFAKNLKYTNQEEGFSIVYPDEWKYVEFKSEGRLQVQLAPVLENLEIGYLFMPIKDVSDFSEDNLSKIFNSVTAPFISDKNLKESGSSVNNYLDNDNPDTGYPRYEIFKEYTEKNGTVWSVPFCFIINDGKLYLLYGFINSTTFKNQGEIIFYKMLESIEFE